MFIKLSFLSNLKMVLNKNSENYYDIDSLINLIYLDKMGDIKEVKKDFILFYEANTSLNFKILTFFHTKELCAYDLENHNESINFDTIKKTIQRLSKDGYIKESKLVDRKKYYVISENGIIYLKNYLNKEFVNKSDYIINNIRINRSHKVKEDQQQKEFTKNKIIEVMNLLESKNQVEDFVRNGFFTFDLLEILEVDLELGEYIISDFTNAYSLFKQCLRDRISEISKYKENIENIKFINLDKIRTQQYNISSIPKKSHEFINTKGILLKRNPQIREEVTKMYYLCTNPSCPHSEDKIKSIGAKLKTCPKCKSPVDLVDRKIKRFVDLEIKDTENDTSIKIKAYDNLIEEVCNLKIGEEISVNGYITTLETQNTTTKEIILNRVFILNNFKSSANSVYLNNEEEEEVIKKIEELKNNNISIKDYLLDYMKELYPYHPQEVFDLYLIPQILKFDLRNEDIIHVLSIGSPNTYKTSFLKYMSNIFPKPKEVLFRQLSVDKFYGGVKADGLTDVGIAMTQRGGSLIIDEIDKDPDSYDKSSNMLNQVMSDQEASKERVGASIYLKNVNIRIYGVMNHNLKYKESSERIIQWINKNIHDSTLTRFFLIDFDSFVKEEAKKDVIDKMSSNNHKIISEEEYEMKKNIIIHLRKKEIDLSLIQEEIRTFLYAIFNSFKDKEHLTRNVQQVKNLVIGICRLKGVDTATMEELEEAKKLINFTYQSQGICLDKFVKNLEMSIDNKTTFDIVKDCSSSILSHLKENEDKGVSTTNINEIKKVFSELFTEDTIDKSLAQLKHERVIFEPRKNEWRKI